MHLYREHIVTKVITALVIIALLTPSLVKFSHIFETHIHQVCKNSQKIHFHEFDLDCQIYWFKLNPQFHITNTNFEVKNGEETLKRIVLKPHLFIFNQYRTFSLRGPPGLV